MENELIHVTEDGTEQYLRNPGDALVQRGTMRGGTPQINESGGQGFRFMQNPR